MQDEHEAQLKRLEELLKEQDKSAKMLVRRDLELMRANQKLQSLDRAKSEFISVAAHQLRTPLSAVKWALKMIIDGDLGAVQNDDQRVFLMRANDSNNRMISTVNDLLDVDHFESGKFTFELMPFQISDLIDSALLEFNRIAENKKIKLLFNKPESTLPKVIADPEKMRMVVQNLLDNALKYTREEGTITISLSANPDFVTVVIADSGIGVPADQQEFIFKKFFRAGNAKKVVTDGSGLGLYIVKEIIEKMGGRIWFESQLNKGTTFSFTVPLFK
jgi:signal transduction histidine kinase